MEIVLNPEKKLESISKEFNSFFSLLKIEFYNGTHNKNEGSTIENRIDNQKLLTEINPEFKEVVLKFSKTESVSDFEKKFKDLTKISIQIFRKSNNLWLQTISTDHWTLEQQQSEAEYFATKIDNDEPSDYHEQE